MIGLGVTGLHFLDGPSEPLPQTGVTVIVGPNNAGKSVLLREIYEKLASPRNSTGTRWLSSIDVAAQGTENDFRNWFETVGRIVPAGRPGAGELAFWQSNIMGEPMTVDTAWRAWSRRTGMGGLTQKLIAYHEALSRGSLLGTADARDQMTPSAQPLHHLWDNKEAEEQLSKLLERAFGFRASINRYSQRVDLLMGSPGIPDELPPASRELLDAYAKLPALSTQGDGVKSFAGLLLHSLNSGVLVTFIDEPEAFLHPPQARLLGRYLAEETSSTGQVIIATHSSDVLEGVLDGASDREVKVIRVSQDRYGKRAACTLDPSRVSRLWQDPLLRYSRMLDGLFQKGVIVCEADNDCRFYAATLDAYLENRVEPDIVFTHVGGKGRLARAAAELVNFGVQVVVIGDLDLLQEVGQFESLVEILGQDKEEYRDDLELIRRQIFERQGGPLVGGLKREVSELIKRRDTSAITDTEAKAIIKSVKVKSGWSEVKRAGARAFDDAAAQAVIRTISRSRECGIFLVPVGELECWYFDLNAGHGVSYVTAVLEAGLHKNLTADLSLFLAELARFFRIDIAEGR